MTHLPLVFTANLNVLHKLCLFPYLKTGCRVLWVGRCGGEEEGGPKGSGVLQCAMASAGLGVRAAPQLLPIGTLSAGAQFLLLPCKQSTRQGHSQLCLGELCLQGVKSTASPLIPTETAHSRTPTGSAPSAPVHPHSTSPCPWVSLGPFTSHSFLLVQFMGVFAQEVWFFFPGGVGTQSTVVGMCASSAQQVKLRTSQAPTVGLEEVDFLPQSACLCVSVLSCSVCCPPCRLSARFSRAHHLC